MKPYQTRVIEEAAELQDRAQRLQAFVQSPQLLELPTIDQELMIKQLDLMLQLHSILTARINRFKA